MTYIKNKLLAQNLLYPAGITRLNILLNTLNSGSGGGGGSLPTTGLTGILQAEQFPALTGDLTTSEGSLVTTLATVNSNVGAFGSATQVGTFTINAKGLTIAASNVTITPAIGSITGLGTSVGTALGVAVGSTGSFIVNGGALGTPSSGVVTNLTGTASININGTVNGNTFTTGTGTLTIGAGKTLTANNSIAFTGTDGTVMTFPTTSATIARTDGQNTFTGAQFFVNNLTVNGSSNTYRTTNGGSNIGGVFGVTVDGSISVAGAKAFYLDATASTGQLVFSAANGTRQIARAGIGLTNLVNTAASESADLSLYTQSAGAVASEKLRITSLGGISVTGTNTAAATLGAQTINKPSGSVNFAAGASTLVVTNSLVTTTSVIHVQVYGTDTTAISARVTRASGSFTITLNAAATAETAVGFIVINNF